uniref:N-acetyltransferase domain-containing protein n=1 Tax=Desertifilum tharense IPPAS B-1220 TaxID=1781255 RepID=A0A1E5QKU0_9CYAN|nr:hypothetical protein BH720_11215 [Desertifilum tharense IPPAS B-1220]
MDLILHRGRSLTFRRVLPEDAPLLMAQMYQNREFMRLFRLNDFPNNEAQLRQQIQQRLQTPPQQLFYLDGVLVHHTHGVIGLAALADYAPLHRRAEFLIGLFDPAHRFSGYGLEASLMLLDLGFNQYGLNRLYAYTYGYNAIAQQGLKGLGFNCEGVLAQHVFDRERQQFIDLHIHAILLEQFRQSQRLSRLSLRLLGRDITQVPPAKSGVSPEVSTLSPAASTPSSRPHLPFVRSGSLYGTP